MGGFTGCAGAALMYEIDKARGFSIEVTMNSCIVMAEISPMDILQINWQLTSQKAALWQHSPWVTCARLISSWKVAPTCSTAAFVLHVLEVAALTAKLCSGSKQIQINKTKHRI
jgi:hypothetical protein